MRTCIHLLSGLAAVFSLATAAIAQDDVIPFAPYGMDPVPYAVFFSGDNWDRYGTDPVPNGATSDMGFRDVYGLDAIPEAAVPHLHRLKDTLPHETLQVLTSALEEDLFVGATPNTGRSAPSESGPPPMIAGTC